MSKQEADASADKGELTNRESAIMRVLWELGEGTAEQVRGLLADESHDSTVRTMLRVLETKGYLERDSKGRAHVYRPIVDQRKVQGGAIRSVLNRLFGGSAPELVLRLLEDEYLTPEQLDDIKKRRQTQPKKPKNGR